MKQVLMFSALGCVGVLGPGKLTSAGFDRTGVRACAC